MLKELQRLIEALREELKEYGEMLALLDQQQDLVVRRAADDMLAIVAAITRQSGVLQSIRAQRELHRREVSAQLRLAEDTAFGELIPRLPEDYRPLLSALVAENNELLVRVQQRARQNHLLLSRSVELMQGVIGALVPGSRTTVYGGNGSLAGPSGPARSRYEAVG